MEVGQSLQMQSCIHVRFGQKRTWADHNMTQRVISDKTQSEHNWSTFGWMATVGPRPSERCRARRRRPSTADAPVVVHHRRLEPDLIRQSIREGFVTVIATCILTMVLICVTSSVVSFVERTPAGHSGWRSESGSRGQRFVTSALGRLRQKRPAGIMTGPRVYPLDWDRRERITPAL